MINLHSAFALSVTGREKNDSLQRSNFFFFFISEEGPVRVSSPETWTSLLCVLALPADPRAVTKRRQFFSIRFPVLRMSHCHKLEWYQRVFSLLLFYSLWMRLPHKRGKENNQSIKYFFLIDILICVDSSGKGEILCCQLKIVIQCKPWEKWSIDHTFHLVGPEAGPHKTCTKHSSNWNISAGSGLFTYNPRSHSLLQHILFWRKKTIYQERNSSQKEVTCRKVQ